MGVHVVLPGNLKEWAELERELDNLEEYNYDEYVTVCRAYSKAWLYFMMARVLDSSKWVLPDVETEYWGLPKDCKVMRHPYCWDFINNEVDHGAWHNSAYIISRGFIKTTTAKSLVLQSILQDPEVCWLYVSKDLKLAKIRFQRIREEMRTNRLLKDIGYDIFYEDPEKERSSKFTEEWVNVKRKSVRDEYTIRAIGLERSLPVGDHYRRHCFDDCVDKDTVNTLELRSHMWSQFEAAMSLRDNYDYIKVLFGTPYHYNDLHAEAKKKGVFTFYERAAEDLNYPPPEGYEVGTDERPALEGRPVFLGPELLVQQRRDKGDDYYPQMLLDVQGKSGVKFDPDYMRYYDNNPFTEAKKYNMKVFVCVDPSSGKESKGNYKNDPACISVVGLGWDGKWNFLDCVLDTFDPDELCRKTVDVAMMWNSYHHKVHAIIVEDTGQATFLYYTAKEAARRGQGFNFIGLDCKMPKVTDPVKGIEGRINTFVLPRLRDRSWKFPKQLLITSSEWSGRKDVISEYLIPEELEKFGFTNCDEVLDTMSMPFIPYKKEGKLVIPAHTSPKKLGYLSDAPSAMSRNRRRGSWMAT